ncbi:MAG: DUF1538 domain-containing protein [Nitrospirota bacterium]|nr:DUF1538 domain-containing protein [Nitrospirota bacterium]
MNGLLTQILEGLANTTRDVLPVVLVIGFFQFVYFKKPLTNPHRVIPGLVLVVLGLYLFVEGLSLGLFPLGETMALQFSRPQNLGWVYAFAFALGYATTLAEPALIAVSMKAEEITTGGVRQWPLRNAVAFGVALGIAVGVFRIVRGHPLHWYIIGGYLLVLAQTRFAPREIIALAYDSGGVTTSTVTVPLVTALGLGLATNIPGRNPIVDGFGLIAFASLFPIITVLGYATLARFWGTMRSRSASASPKEEP